MNAQLSLSGTSGYRNAGSTAEQGIVIGDVPLTPIQCWFFEQEHPHTEHWNQSMLLE
ncbi:hypothetical protein HFP67_28100 [Bacillus sp. CB102A.1]